MGTWTYLLKKVGQLIITLLFILIFNFFLFRAWLPGDPVSSLTRSSGAQFSAAEQQELIREYGLDKPLTQQFWIVMGDTVVGKLGVSSVFAPETVSQVLLRLLPWTLLLVGVSTIVSTIVGILIGIYAGWRRAGWFDRSSMGTSLTLYSMPEFVLGMLLLIVFSTWLGWFPPGGHQTTDAGISGFAAFTDIANHLFLPALTLALAFIGEYYLVMRSSLLDVLGEDFITTARAKGVREKNVLRHHAVRNALLPTVTLIALNFGFVIGGAITVELVFSYQGLGQVTYTALNANDYWLLGGLFLFFSLAVLVANFIADLIYVYLDPRVREA